MNTDQIKGKFEQVVGKAKQAVGEGVGDEKTANEGLGDQVKGAGRETWGNVKDAFHGTAEENAAAAHNESAGTRSSLSDKLDHAKTAVNERIDEYKEAHR